MQLLSSLRGLFRREPSIQRRARRRLSLEALEDRFCLSYTVIDLGTLGGTFSQAGALNESGQVAGHSYTASGELHAFLWQNGAMTDLGTLGGTASSASDVNDVGQVVGSARTLSGDYHAFVWQGGIMTDLGTLGGTTSHADGINGQGQIVGSAHTAGGVRHAFVWESGVLHDLNNFLPANSGWELSSAGDLNGNGQIVGSGVINGQSHAFLLTDDDGVFANGGATFTDLGTLGGSYSEAVGTNSTGQVVGASHTKNQLMHGFRYSAGVMTDLKTLGGSTSNAQAINDAGQVVGESETRTLGVYRAFIWQSGKMTDLNKQLPRGPGWTLELANDINGDGQIVGKGVISGQTHAFLMVPGDSALQAESVSTTTVAETLHVEQAQSLLAEALVRWEAAGVDTSGLGRIDVRIADLPDAHLGLASGNTIWLDDNAAGWGWFVDPTPWDDSEFTTPGDQGEQGTMDLLTVLAHEIGHLLGQDHADDGVMAEALLAGTRWMPLASIDADWLAAARVLFSKKSRN